MDISADFKFFIATLVASITIFISIWKFNDSRFEKLEGKVERLNEKFSQALLELSVFRKKHNGD